MWSRYVSMASMQTEIWWVSISTFIASYFLIGMFFLKLDLCNINKRICNSRILPLDCRDDFISYMGCHLASVLNSTACKKLHVCTALYFYFFKSCEWVDLFLKVWLQQLVGVPWCIGAPCDSLSSCLPHIVTIMPLNNNWFYQELHVQYAAQKC